ncbi:hypothetical protein [Flavobacterium johnsoniae]|uniref:Uncharacterized protein n=1 Tax=Flavobacterium johnsoniae (strain ATCC 17061 / DSM 2064 / JCM 8514 / BCRC 14874 / CCUG 350202 / NBRC 14942 / NCIMB 11054 / UW101) TaxID=376686 RepID=A5FLQ2_FLAJ1|nr:hypothetical protein [Flavobacterium johnsoniae]ABQ03868.1 hypothetical protein Fjoh_0834 [Flavobacterium johnsoniae UW101]OXE96262.1 hypothetical protein B0A63_22360 [Flavobacterium johnsoniae UW101]WQG79267.1 hypothetical protein SR927_14685 [Flavobacterium johnsoniae UW101]SHK05124.1 hypothetical protein SAMN05444146_0236 [Flavobacterium johnsoniae]
MITIDKFDRVYDDFFCFRYTIKDITYRSGIFFSEKCSDKHFAEIFNSIQENLIWLKQNVDIVKSNIKDRLPIDADVEVFYNIYIIAFSLFFEKKSSIPTIQLAYGNEEGETYLIAKIKDKQIISVELN